MSALGPEARLRGAVLLAKMRGQVHWLRRPDVRARAYERTELLLRQTPRAGDVRRVARAQIVERAVTYRLAREYELVEHVRVAGAGHLEAARAEDRGGIIVTAHLACVLLAPYVLCRRGYVVRTIAGGFLKHPLKERHRLQARLGPAMEELGGGFIFAGTGAFATMQQHVKDGGWGFVAVDMPGSLDAEFLSKPARLGQAAFRIAWETRCPVVPAFMRRRRLSTWVEALPRFLPDDYPDFESFAAAILRVVEQEVLDQAEIFAFQVALHLWPGGSAANAAPNRERWSQRLAATEGALHDVDSEAEERPMS